MSYSYGDSVTYQDGNVYYGDTMQATGQEYYDQAAGIADAGQTTQDDQWMPLGVFYVVTDEGQTASDKVVQLALNKDGAVQGALYDRLADQQTALNGAVDKQAQRVAIRFEGNDMIVAEMGLYNLTEDEVPVLVHFGPDRQEKRLLVRQQPPDGAGTSQ
jgi:hypothetical protein